MKQVGLRSLAKFWKITGLRRGQFGGAEALVLDFVPLEKTNPKGKSEEMASKLAGSIFLDERTLDALHLDARLVASIRIYGFLASVGEGGTLAQDFQQVNGELFMPAKIQARFPTRALFSNLVAEFDTTWTDFQKFSMDGITVTDAHLLPKGK